MRRKKTNKKQEGIMVFLFIAVDHANSLSRSHDKLTGLGIMAKFALTCLLITVISSKPSSNSGLEVM